MSHILCPTLFDVLEHQLQVVEKLHHICILAPRKKPGGDFLLTMTVVLLALVLPALLVLLALHSPFPLH